jgi:hypothetical protein
MIAFSRLNSIASAVSATAKNNLSKSAPVAATAAAATGAGGDNSPGIMNGLSALLSSAKLGPGASPLSASSPGTDSGEVELELTVPIGEQGIGLIIVQDPNFSSSTASSGGAKSSNVVVKGFRAMPHGKENPSQMAGLRVNDRIKSINGRMLTDHNHAVNLIRSAVGELKICVIRQK